MGRQKVCLLGCQGLHGARAEIETITLGGCRIDTAPPRGGVRCGAWSKMEVSPVQRAQDALDKCHLLTTEAEAALNEAIARLRFPSQSEPTPAGAVSQKVGNSWASRCSSSNSQAVDLVWT